MAVSALNVADFGPDDLLVVDQMVEPVVMGPEGLVRGGTVMLAKRCPIMKETTLESTSNDQQRGERLRRRKPAPVQEPRPERRSPLGHLHRQAWQQVCRQARLRQRARNLRTATLFKRLMGTSTPVKLPAVDLTMTPRGVQRGDPAGALRLPARGNPQRSGYRNRHHRSGGLQPDAEGRHHGLLPRWLVWGKGGSHAGAGRGRHEASCATARATGCSSVYDLGGGTLDIAIAGRASAGA